MEPSDYAVIAILEKQTVDFPEHADTYNSQIEMAKMGALPEATGTCVQQHAGQCGACINNVFYPCVG